MSTPKTNEINEELFREMNPNGNIKSLNQITKCSNEILNNNFSKSYNLNWIQFPTKYSALLPKIRKYLITHIDDYPDINLLLRKYIKWLDPEKLVTLSLIQLAQAKNQKQKEQESCLTKALEGKFFEAFTLNFLREGKGKISKNLVRNIESLIEDTNPELKKLELELRQKFNKEENKSSYKKKEHGHSCSLKIPEIRPFTSPEQEEEIEQLQSDLEDFKWNEELEKDYTTKRKEARLNITNV